ncbi:MAG: hypothetical protein ACK58N_17065, partial [Synechocystis sp.]
VFLSIFIFFTTISVSKTPSLCVNFKNQYPQKNPKNVSFLSMFTLKLVDFAIAPPFLAMNSVMDVLPTKAIN